MIDNNRHQRMFVSDYYPHSALLADCKFDSISAVAQTSW